jgi:hypothetical protein
MMDQIIRTIEYRAPARVAIAIARARPHVRYWLAATGLVGAFLLGHAWSQGL